MAYQLTYSIYLGQIGVTDGDTDRNFGHFPFLCEEWGKVGEQTKGS